jgi:hypothetical protein
MSNTKQIATLDQLINREIGKLEKEGQPHFNNPVHRCLQGAHIYDLIQLRDSLKK